MRRPLTEIEASVLQRFKEDMGRRMMAALRTALAIEADRVFRTAYGTGEDEMSDERMMYEAGGYRWIKIASPFDKDCGEKYTWFGINEDDDVIIADATLRQILDDHEREAWEAYRLRSEIKRIVELLKIKEGPDDYLDRPWLLETFERLLGEEEPRQPGEPSDHLREIQDRDARGENLE